MPSVVCSCGKTIETKPEWAGAFIRCRGCASKVYVPRPEEAPPAADPLQLAAPGTAEAAVPEGEFRPCPYCAERIRKQAVKCRYCGQSLVPGRAGGTAARHPSPRPVRTDTGGTGILVMAILGWAVCGIFHPIAWAMGASHESSCRAQGIEPSGSAKAGKILGMVGTIIVGVVVLIIIIVAAAGGMR